MESKSKIPTQEQTLDIVRKSMKPSVNYGFIEMIDNDNAQYDCRKLENILHDTCHKMMWKNLTAGQALVPQADDWQFWTELATQTISKMHIKIPRESFKAILFGFSTVAWIMAQDWKKGGQHYEDGTPFLKKCMQQGVETQLNMQQGFLNLLD